jgi:alkylation response protein AidB-like acyl-CoA dehydrogenase
MSRNETMRRRAAALLGEGGIFGFGLSEKEHGADIYSTEMKLAANPAGGFLANGRKYYIGNANEAALLSVLGKMPDGKEWVFFAADPKHPKYDLIQNVCNSQSYVAGSPSATIRCRTTRSDPARRRGTPRSTRSTSESTTSAGRRSGSARTPSTKRSTTRRGAGSTG